VPPPKKPTKTRPFADLKFDTQTEGLGKLNRTEKNELHIQMIDSLQLGVFGKTSHVFGGKKN